MCLTSLDVKFALPVGVNHLTKGITASDLDTLDMLKSEIKEINLCLNHLENSRTDTINVPQNCSRHCMNCIETEAVCDMCREKGLTVIEPALRPCVGCLEKEIQCSKQQ